MSLFKRCSQTPGPEPATGPSPRPGGRGRPTPRRKDQQAKNLRSVVPRDRAAAKRKARVACDAVRRRQSEAIVASGEKHLPFREKGPIKRHIRDFVDARLNLGEYSMPLIFVLLIIPSGFSSLLSHYLPVSLYAVLAMNGHLLLAIADAAWCWAHPRHRLIVKFGQGKVKDEGMALFYIISHCFMLRRQRRPAALISQDQYPS